MYPENPDGTLAIVDSMNIDHGHWWALIDCPTILPNPEQIGLNKRYLFKWKPVMKL